MEKIAFVASPKPEAQDALVKLRHKYGAVKEEFATTIVALGGDGLMLETLRRHMDDGLPVFGLNQGTIGFLMNDYSEENLIERIENAKPTIIHPIKMVATDIDGNEVIEYAINEVSFLRQTHQTARLKITIDETVRMSDIICDGMILATAAGSTAYNLSAYGPILPIGSGLLALTPLSVFRPRRWRGALLRDSSKVIIDILENQLRPVAVCADNREFRNITRVEMCMDMTKSMVLLFDTDRSLDDRILAEQFAY